MKSFISTGRISDRYLAERLQKWTSQGDKHFDEETMKYFCKDWEPPARLPDLKTESKTLVPARRLATRSLDSVTKQEAVNMIDDQELYDLIITYRDLVNIPADFPRLRKEVKLKYFSHWLLFKYIDFLLASLQAEMKFETMKKMLLDKVNSRISRTSTLRKHRVTQDELSQLAAFASLRSVSIMSTLIGTSGRYEELKPVSSNLDSIQIDTEGTHLIQQYFLGLAPYWRKSSDQSTSLQRVELSWINTKPSASTLERHFSTDPHGNTLASSYTDTKETWEDVKNTSHLCHPLCDGQSQFNTKIHHHFRPFLSEGLWISNKENHHWKPHRPVHHPELEEKFAKTKTWLRDDDRNLVLLMDRSPIERLSKHFQIKAREKMEAAMNAAEESEETVLDRKKLESLVRNLCEAEAERFWTAVDEWYQRYVQADVANEAAERMNRGSISLELKKHFQVARDNIENLFEDQKHVLTLKVQNRLEAKDGRANKKFNEAYEVLAKKATEEEFEKMKEEKAFLTEFSVAELKEMFEPTLR